MRLDRGLAMATCAFCGRQTTPYVMIGANAVGPTCARKAGLTKAKLPKASMIRVVGRKPSQPRASVPETMDLFAGIEMP